MIKLHGFKISNYYNKVKLALLEKDIAFEEVLVHPSAADRNASPLGKIPYITVDGQPLCESQAIVDYLEAAHPQHPLLPADPLAAAKVRELMTFIDLHLELVARELYPQAFFGSPPLGDEALAGLRSKLQKNIAAFQQLARFAPYVAGEQFTLADCSAWASLPVVGMATKAVFGEDLVAAAGIDVKAYARLVGERPSAQRVTADRKAEQAATAA